MGNKAVDVFLGDKLVQSYRFDRGPASDMASDQDFIERARARLRLDGYAANVIADARFIVRDEPA